MTNILPGGTVPPSKLHDLWASVLMQAAPWTRKMWPAPLGSTLMLSTMMASGRLTVSQQLPASRENSTVSVGPSVLWLAITSSPPLLPIS